MKVPKNKLLSFIRLFTYSTIKSDSELNFVIGQRCCGISSRNLAKLINQIIKDALTVNKYK